LAQSTVSAHLACLRDCRLVDSRPVARQSFYFLTQPSLWALLDAAEGVLSATDAAVALCPNYGQDECR
jgi:ArsR family transcriptional regulator